ncbi:hypothetical protein HU200_001544 [Digitaria exilis]|uniref:Uncharacterized protein n=1 Tax=Digitaria exilis TaxID=1010633 RepID=A0A835FZY5_9POAL|nr:hypothetical protein HU200_001544 [Digitaria exilis]
MYDLAHRTVHNQLRLNSPKHIIDAVSLAVGDSLYVMDRTPVLDNCHGSFEALVYDGEQYNKHDESISEWRWRCLDPPTYVLEPGYKPTRIGGYTVVGGSEIWVSTPGIGTYAFDTSAGTWRKAFRDHAEYVPECDTWLGFSSRTGLLCSSDLRRARPAVVSG